MRYETLSVRAALALSRCPASHCGHFKFYFRAGNVEIIMATALNLAAQVKQPLTEVQIVDQIILAKKMLKSKISDALKAELNLFIQSLETTLRFQSPYLIAA